MEVREIQNEDVKFIVDYWQNATPEFLAKMGADINKIPSADALTKMLKQQIDSPMKKKISYALIWILDKKAIGHCNVNSIDFGNSAFMHLHIWQPDFRKKGVGTSLVKKSIPFFFENLKLKELFCQPKSDNPAPNKTLEKVGFEFQKKYTTIPGALNFEQEVIQWKLTKKQYKKLIK